MRCGKRESRNHQIYQSDHGYACVRNGPFSEISTLVGTAKGGYGPSVGAGIGHQNGPSARDERLAKSSSGMQKILVLTHAFKSPAFSTLYVYFLNFEGSWDLDLWPGLLHYHSLGLHSGTSTVGGIDLKPSTVAPLLLGGKVVYTRSSRQGFQLVSQSFYFFFNIGLSGRLVTSMIEIGAVNMTVRVFLGRHHSHIDCRDICFNAGEGRLGRIKSDAKRCRCSL